MINNCGLPLIFCAIDTPDINRAVKLADIAQQTGCGIKLGLEFFNANGPQGVEFITAKFPDMALFLDLKFHDIPDTVAGAVRSVIGLKPAFMTIHASGGAEMMRVASEAAAEEAGKLGVDTPEILAVTILTSLDDNDLADMGYRNSVDDQVIAMARFAQNSGMDGVICSANEIEPIRSRCGDNFILMVPGIRLTAQGADDQKRVTTPEKAVAAGATHLVIGRAITQADDPVSTVKTIMNNIDACRS